MSGGIVVHAAVRYDTLFRHRPILAHLLRKVVSLAPDPFVAVVMRGGRKRGRPGGSRGEGRKGTAGERVRHNIGGGGR